ncbi:MAG: RNA-directed DNA polymerase [Legionellaceae bacterium]|nr:RNA-directed DNA polymerase [Legionellaceae bacterium]
MFANFYLNPFDHYVKNDLGVRFYGRYVDDFILAHEDKAFLKPLTIQMEQFLQKELELELHPRKRYLQHYRQGIPFFWGDKGLDADSAAQEANIAYPALANPLIKVAIPAKTVAKGLNCLCHKGEEVFWVNIRHSKRITLCYFRLKQSNKDAGLFKNCAEAPVARDLGCNAADTQSAAASTSSGVPRPIKLCK